MNSIEAAVAPLKKDAIESARQRIEQMIQKTITELQNNNWDAQIVAPYPNSRTDHGVQYHNKLNKYCFVRSITASNDTGSRRVGDPAYRKRSTDHENAVIKQWEEAAAFQYEAFVAKLVSKIGDCVSATLEGNHVWGHSILHIVKADGTKEKWKTQQIFKISCKGKPHNQWPTRKVK